MPINPDQITAKGLPVSLRGYSREETEDLLLRIGWDYRRLLGAHEKWTLEERALKERISALEAGIAAQNTAHAAALEERDRRSDDETGVRAAAQEEELERLRRRVGELETREELTHTLLQTAQRSAREMREAAREEAEAILKAAHRRATEIEDAAQQSARHSHSEAKRLRLMESDLRDRLRAMLESVLDENGGRPAPDAQPAEPAAEAPSDTAPVQEQEPSANGAGA